RDGALWIAATGIEDHPLDRSEGSFGFVDSFLFLYRVQDGRAERRAEVNLSELGVVTPKAVLLDVDGGRREVTVTGYATDRCVRLRWNDPGVTPEITATTVPPGTRAAVRVGDRVVFADPLLDAWVAVGPSGDQVVPVEPKDDRPLDARVGEALFFTTLMAPFTGSEGRLSRFTCEACHLEGYVDGRTHSTGRGTVRVITKPLLGLFSNRPYFSRALDPDLTTMVDSEF